MLLVLLGLALLPSGAATAGYSEVKSVSRDVPEVFSAGEMVEVTLSIKGEPPLAVGIVEEIPEGCRFPENDWEISDTRHFRVDRENGIIAFSALNTKEIKYRVIAPPAGGDGSFKGQWVDLLVQTQKLNEGKERWNPVVDLNSHAPAMESRAAPVSSVSGPESTETSHSVPGFETGFGILALLSCLFASRTSGSKGKKGGKKE